MNSTDKLLQILEAGIQSVRPSILFPRLFAAPDPHLSQWLSAPRRFLFTAGKAAISSASAVLQQSHCTDLFALSPHGISPGDVPRDKIRFGTHPVPDANSVSATQEALQWLDSLPDKSELLVILSGGSSALLVSPSTGISIESKFALNRQLLSCGAPIQDMNTIRKHCSSVKGGQLGARCERLHCSVLAISDVIGDDLAVIGSGPFYPDPSTFSDSKHALQNYGIWEEIPSQIRTHLNLGITGAIPETPKPGSLRIPHDIVASNAVARASAAATARSLGYSVVNVEQPVAGLVEDAAEHIAVQAAKCAPKTAVILGGEVTVRLTGHGTGGRNQHLALLIARLLKGESLYFAAAGTDGVDGNSDAAGAWVDGDTLNRGARMLLDIEDCIASFNSFSFFQNLNQSIHTGPTGTNVMDLYVILRD